MLTTTAPSAGPSRHRPPRLRALLRTLDTWAQQATAPLDHHLPAVPRRPA